jgi:hypothetical protein
VIVQVPGVWDPVYVLMTCPEAFVLPVADTGPQDPVTFGVVVNDTGSSNATPDPVVTVTVIAELLETFAVRVLGSAVTLTALGGGAKEPKASTRMSTGTLLLLYKLTAPPLRGTRVKFWSVASDATFTSLTPGVE